MDRKFRAPRRGNSGDNKELRKLQDTVEQLVSMAGIAGQRTGTVITQTPGGQTFDSSIYQPYWSQLTHKDNRGTPIKYAFAEQFRPQPDQGNQEPGNWQRHGNGRCSWFQDKDGKYPPTQDPASALTGKITKLPQPDGSNKWLMPDGTIRDDPRPKCIWDGTNGWSSGNIVVPTYEVRGINVPDDQIGNPNGQGIVEQWMGYDGPPAPTYYLFIFFVSDNDKDPSKPSRLKPWPNPGGNNPDYPNLGGYNPGQIGYKNCQVFYHCPDASGKPTMQRMLRQSDLGTPGYPPPLNSQGTLDSKWLRDKVLPFAADQG